MTNRHRRRARHRAHKERTLWRRFRFERGYFPCGDPITASEIAARHEGHLLLIDSFPHSRIELLEISPATVGMLDELARMRKQLFTPFVAEAFLALADRGQPPRDRAR